MKTKGIYKYVTVLIFCAGLLAQSFGKFLIVADYYANTVKYAKNCVNKTKPKLNCNGKCQMMKKLQQEEEKDQETAEREHTNLNETVLSSKSFFAHIEKPFQIIEERQFFPKNTNEYKFNCIHSIFHPPQI